MEAFERILTVLEERLFTALQAAAPEDLLVGAARNMRRGSWRLIAAAWARCNCARLKRQFEQKQLLVNYNLPRLSLFYMSQQ